MALSISHRPPPAGKPLDASLRGYLASNADIVTRITKPVHLDDVGALSAQSDKPILFENIVEKPGFRLCDILVKNRVAQARALGDDAGKLSAHARLPAAPASARIEGGQERPGEGDGEASQRGRLDRAADPLPQGQGRGDHVAFAEARGVADPVMRPADGQCDEKHLAAADLQAGHAHGVAIPPRRGRGAKRWPPPRLVGRLLALA